MLTLPDFNQEEKSIMHLKKMSLTSLPNAKDDSDVFKDVLLKVLKVPIT